MHTSPRFVLPDPTQARFPGPARRVAKTPKALLPQRKSLQFRREDPGKAGQRIHAWLCKHHNETVISAALFIPDLADLAFHSCEIFLFSIFQRELICSSGPISLESNTQNSNI